ncbi:MAG: hypothetical protein J0I84_03270 [Terrimonas sp.]|uniref:hypothetical protein n=1 Tax=Terrimonas sp. TaxID=1914338 RepID=UPI001980A3C8|nr:hypothetical protein [Terrimonas sp.]MBN8786081.1 hypothetical protein [Terrimonas sp.]
MKIIEVFKTNVADSRQSILLLQAIRLRFPAYIANFDLHDCDNILRIESSRLQIVNENIVGLLNEYGYYAEALPD